MLVGLSRSQMVLRDTESEIGWESRAGEGLIIESFWERVDGLKGFNGRKVLINVAVQISGRRVI